jgi:methionine biosynthesis protein MetW
VEGYGLEIDSNNIIECVKRGVCVVQCDLDAGLPDFDTQSFDYVIMTQTLQAVRYPDLLLKEMLRVGREGIVTLPNFGYWRHRLQLGLFGRMPQSNTLPADWYNTNNIHLCTLEDFEQLCKVQDIAILEKLVMDHDHRSRAGITFFPNLLGEIAIYRCQRGAASPA